jgi:hypothetical protein
MDTNRKYLIIDLSEIDKINYYQILITSFETMRKSYDGTKGIIKWDGATPEFVSTLNWKSSIYNIEEIMEILETEEWTGPIQTTGSTIN